MRWTRIVEPDGRRGAEHMAVDCSLLRRAQEEAAFLRLYCWSPPCLSFGRNEPVLNRYDAGAIRRLGLDAVRRPTGGRAVWHDHELTYAIAAPIALFGTLRTSYEQIHAMLAAALVRLGVAAELARRPSGRTASLAGGACFAAPVGGEIVAGGDKLVGSAQVREGRAFLQHGSVLLDNAQDVVAHITRGQPVHPKATSLSDLLGRAVSFDEVAHAVCRQAETTWRGTWNNGKATMIGAACGRFDDPSWTWRR